jgi:hypothetical protein
MYKVGQRVVFLGFNGSKDGDEYLAVGQTYTISYVNRDLKVSWPLRLHQPKYTLDEAGPLVALDEISTVNLQMMIPFGCDHV